METPAADTIETPAATDEAPAGTEETVVEPPADPEAEPTPDSEESTDGPLTKREARAEMVAARQKAKEDAAGDEEEEAAATPTKDRYGRKHDPKTGKFLPEDGEEDEEEDTDAAAGTVAADDTGDGPAAEGGEDPGEGSDGPAEKGGEGRISVEIDSHHPVADLNVPAIEVGDERQAEVVKALLNGTYKRVKEVDTLTAANRDLEAELAKLQEKLIRIESSSAAVEKWKQTPEYQEYRQTYLDIKDTHGKEKADRYWAGIQTELKALMDGEYEERMTKVEAERAQRAGQAWANEAWDRLGNLPEPLKNLPDLRKWFDEEIQAFDARIANGQYDHLEADTPEKMSQLYHREFAKLMASRIRSEPAALERYNAAKKSEQNGAPTSEPEPTDTSKKAYTEADLEKEREKAVEAYKAKMASKREDVPTNPLAGAPARPGARPGATRGAGDGEVDTSKMTVSELKAHAKKGARQDARNLMGSV